MSEVEIKVTIDGVEYSQKQLKDLATGANKAADGMDNLGKETEKAGEEQGFFAKKLDGIKEQFGKLKAGFGDIKKGYQAMSNGLAGMAKGFGLSSKAAKIFGTTTSAAIAATGIGLIVPLVLALVNYFQNLEGGAKALKKVMAGLGAIISNVGSALKLLLSGDIVGAFNTMKDAVQEATAAVDDQFTAEKKLSELRQKTIIQNAQLNAEIEASKKILEDTTLSLDDRLSALDSVTAATKKLAENQLVETQLALQAAEAQLTLTNNYEERRQKQEEIAELQASLIDQQTQIANIEYDAEKVAREIRTQAADERKAAIAERIAQQKTVSETLQALRIEDIDDEKAKAEANLEVQKQAALATLKENKATAAQLLEAEELYENQLLDLRAQFTEKEEAVKRANEEKAEAERLAKQERLKGILEQAYFESIENDMLRAQQELLFQENQAMAELELLGATEEQKQLVRDNYQKKREKLAKEEADYNASLRKAERDNELQLAADAFSAIASIVGQESAVGKAAAIAATTIQTYQAAQGAYASQLAIPSPDAPVRAAIAAGIAISSGLANVAAIVRTKTPGDAGGGGGSSAGSPGAPSIPSFSADSGSLDLGFGGPNFGDSDALDELQPGTPSGEQKTAPLRAYVVATEVSSAQEANKKIEDIAKL